MLEVPTSFLSQVYEINFDGISTIIFKLTSLQRLNLLNLNSYRHLNSPPNTTRDQGNDLKTQWNEMVLIVKQKQLETVSKLNNEPILHSMF